MFGLAGGSAGQFVVGPMLASGVSWSSLMTVSGGPLRQTLEHYQTTFTAFLFDVGLAIVLALLLKETGPAVRPLARQ